MAVGVHTTQFAIRDPQVGLFKPVLELAARIPSRFKVRWGETKWVFKQACLASLPRDIVFPPEVLRHLVMDAAGRISLLPDETSEPLPGLRAWFCGAHHRSSLCFVVPTAAGRVALTDAIFCYRNFEERIPLGLSESLEEHHHLYARLARECDLVLPLYDPALAQRHPSLVIG